jgi:predicted transposase YbfD/YdcC
MQTLSSPIPQRIAHYKSEADRLRRMAEAEPIAAIRDELLAVARQYDILAEGL